MIIEFNSWNKIHTFINKNNLNTKSRTWLLDLDDTIIKCKNYIGSTEWFDYNISKYKGCESLLINRWCQIIKFLEFELIDDLIPELLNNLKGKKIILTARHHCTHDITLKHLDQFNIKSSIDNQILCGNFKKHDIVQKYVFETENNNYSNYIFIDDKYKNIKLMNDKYPSMYCFWFNKNITQTKNHKKFLFYSIYLICIICIICIFFFYIFLLY